MTPEHAPSPDPNAAHAAGQGMSRLNPAALERLAPRGREFLRAIAALYEKLERRSAGAQRYFAKVRAKVEQRRQQYRRSPELLRRWPPYRDGAIDPSVLSAFADDYLPSARFEPQGADRQRIAWTKEPPRGFPTELIREDGVWRVVLPEKPAAPRP